MPGLAQCHDRLLQGQIRFAGHPVESVQHAPGLLHHLEGGGNLSVRIDFGIGHAFRARMFRAAFRVPGGTEAGYQIV